MEYANLTIVTIVHGPHRVFLVAVYSWTVYVM